MNGGPIKNKILISIKDCENIIIEAFKRSGSSYENAKATAISLVRAQIDGHDGHGLVRVPMYAAQLKTKKINGFSTPRKYNKSHSVLMIDANDGLAYPAMDFAINELISVTKKTGIAVAGIYNSHHSGILGYPVEKAALEGLICLGFSNTPAAVPPWGGINAIFGTNPLAFACPNKNTAPIVVDISTSKVSRSKISSAAEKGISIPNDWAIGADGKATTNPDVALSGSLLPMGEWKGTGLGLMVEILSACLIGANLSANAGSYRSKKGKAPHTGQLFITLDPKFFIGITSMQNSLEYLISLMRQQSGVHIPGTGKLKQRIDAKNNGILIRKTLFSEIVNI